MKNFRAKLNQRARQIAISLALFVCLMISLPRGAWAAEPPDTTKPCALTLVCNYQMKALAGMQLRLYRVADGTSDAGFTLSGAFASLPVSLSGLSAAGWSTAAATLASYVQPNGISATASAQTDSKGSATLPNLAQGLYLVVGDTLKIGQNSYNVEPFLVALPTLTKSGAWQYDVTAYPKITDPEEALDYYDLTILKQWVDQGSNAKRPDSIEIALLRDGVVYENRTLTAAGNWRYTWTNLSNQYIWSAIETTTLSDYTVKYQRSSKTLVIINTAKSLDTTDDTEDVDKDIPKTGLNWWPVYLLAGAGVVIFTIGWRRRYGAGGKHHAS